MLTDTSTQRPPSTSMKEWRAAALPSPVETSVPTLPPKVDARVKKKVPWKGKFIIILFPKDEESVERGYLSRPMTEEDVQKKLKVWEDLKYDTRGFNLGPGLLDDEETSPSQSRACWPLISDILIEKQRGSFKVSIPDKREWDIYVQELQEAKLRSLGVSLGDEDSTSTYPLPSLPNLSRRTSIQYPALPFSPPIPTSSANSNNANQNIFSPSLLPGASLSTNQSSHPASTGSPLSMNESIQGKLNSHHSISFSNNEHPFGSPFQYAQQQSPVVWSPGQMIHHQGLSLRGRSPTLQNLGAMMSPALTLPQEGYFTPTPDAMLHLQKRKSLLPSQLPQQQSQPVINHTSPRLQKVKEYVGEDSPSENETSVKTPEARKPTHHLNSSLQEEINAAEYHLEGQIQRELEHEDYSPHSDKSIGRSKRDKTQNQVQDVSLITEGLGSSRQIAENEEKPVLHHPKPHSRTHSFFHDDLDGGSPDLLVNSMNTSILKTEEQVDLQSNISRFSESQTPRKHATELQNQPMNGIKNKWTENNYQKFQRDNNQSTQGKIDHTPKASLSKLNVAAKEFLFNPTNNLLSNVVNFSSRPVYNGGPPNGGDFRPVISLPQMKTPGLVKNSTSIPKGNFNFSSPAFEPQKSDFNFSSITPNFRNPAVFNSNPYNPGVTSHHTPIFGNIDLSSIGITKPSKKSKAIPIVRPHGPDSPKLEVSTAESDDRRIHQSEARFKRPRGQTDTVDSVPVFSGSTMPLEQKDESQSTRNETLSTDINSDRTEITVPVLDTGANPSSQKSEADYGPVTDLNESSKENVDPDGHKKYTTSSAIADSETKLNTMTASTVSSTAIISSPIVEKQKSSLPQLPPSLDLPSFPKFISLSGSKFTRTPTPSEENAPINKTDRPAELKISNFESNERSTNTSLKSPSHLSCPRDSENRPPECELVSEDKETLVGHLSHTDLSLPPLNQQSEAPEYHQPSPVRCIKVPDLDSSSPVRLLPQQDVRSSAPSPSPKRFHPLPGETKIFTRTMEDAPAIFSPHKLNVTANNLSQSDWDDIINEDEESKIRPRAQFFDNHVNKIVGGILDERLGPLELSLGTIQEGIDNICAYHLSTQDRRSISGALSDADDEDEESSRPPISSRWEKRLDKIKVIIQESIASSNNTPSNNARLTDLEYKLKQSEARADKEIETCRSAEDRLSEIQRQLRISSEEERRLREVNKTQETKILEISEENNAKVRLSEEKFTQSKLQIAILEASEKSLHARIQQVENELSISNQKILQLQKENECLLEASKRNIKDAEQANEKNKNLIRTIEKLKVQSEESIRAREVMRGKLIGLQEDMARAARELMEENSQRAKKEQELICRQEVLDARLQAEARTRERLEVELRRLENGEREALRAVADCNKMEAKLSALREEKQNIKKEAIRYKLEAEEAREVSSSQVQRTKQYMQADIEEANHRIDIMRGEYERQISSLRGDIDQTKLDADTARERCEMLIEEAELSKKSLESSFNTKLADTVEDLQTQHDRRLQTTLEEAQRHEQHLLDRLSLSSAKTEHLQDRVAHLEEKLEIANAAATAAATAAKTARSASNGPSRQLTPILPSSKVSVTDAELPERISPQALRESIISLQEQLQERESTIESLKSTISSLDPDSSVKISKRDDEITWLRELLAVRKSDLTDIVQSLEQDQWDVDRVRDAAIRLRTNLEMQEQELERAINGGSALPNLAASLRDVTVPRVAQAVGPIAAVWGSWRKIKSEGVSGHNSDSGSTIVRNVNNSKSGLLTQSSSTTQRQNTSAQGFRVFGPPSSRFSSAQLANRPRVPVRGMPPKKVGDLKASKLDSCSETEDKTPDNLPILKDSSYDQDASEEFSDAGFYDETSAEGDESEDALNSGHGN